MISILHVSDLHRSPDDPVRNETLLAAILRDLESQLDETPAIHPPNAIVVSGDVIQGARLGAPNAANEIREQYDVAEDFLRELTKRLIGGDRTQVVIVPGNHDVDWNVSRAAMREVPLNQQDPDLTTYSFPGSRFRFNPKDRKLYEIVDQSLYNQRLDGFHNFLERFYSGADLPYPLEKGRQYNLFELDNGRVLVAGYSSCSSNDCYRHVGEIEDGVIGKSYLESLEKDATYALKIAVWHHSVRGAPDATDYMNISRVREMINQGFRLGLHGHQHSSEIFTESIHTASEDFMAVVSAGSLCVGPRELPVGEPRQYNLIEIEDDCNRGKVHLRGMEYDRIFGPRRLSQFGGNSFKPISWTPRMTPVGTTRDHQTESINAAIIEAESCIGTNPARAATILLGIKPKALPVYGRRLLLQALETANDWKNLEEVFVPPTSIDELTALVHTAERNREYAAGLSLLKEFGPQLDFPQPLFDELELRLTAAQESYR